MPADRLAFAVRVGCKQNAVGFLGLGFQLFDQFLLALDRDIFRGIAMLDINAQLAGGQVPHMAHAGRDLVPRPKVFANRLGFCRGLYND